MKKLNLLLLVLIISCGSNYESQKERRHLLAINEEQRVAHMTNNAELLVSSIADSLITVDSGSIFLNSNQQVKERFTSYFSTVKYVAWDDLQEPIIDVSEDGNLATMSVRKRTITEDNLGNMDTTIFAWTSAFKKVDEQWKMFSITSTDNR